MSLSYHVKIVLWGYVLKDTVPIFGKTMLQLSRIMQHRRKIGLTPSKSINLTFILFTENINLRNTCRRLQEIHPPLKFVRKQEWPTCHFLKLLSRFQFQLNPDLITSLPFTSFLFLCRNQKQIFKLKFWRSVFVLNLKRFTTVYFSKLLELPYSSEKVFLVNYEFS